MGKITYSSEFAIKGGIQTKQSWNCPNEPSVEVYVHVTNQFYSKNNPQLEIHLRKKGIFGFHTVDSKRVNINEGGGRVYLKGNDKGLYQIYFRHYAGELVTADFEVKLTYEDPI